MTAVRSAKVRSAKFEVRSSRSAYSALRIPHFALRTPHSALRILSLSKARIDDAGESGAELILDAKTNAGLEPAAQLPQSKENFLGSRVPSREGQLITDPGARDLN